MGTSKHVAILLIVALTGLLTAGQDQPVASSQAAPRGPSDTRSASCLVRLTVDPAILPLNPWTFRSLIDSRAVLAKALRDVLSVNTVEDFMQPKAQGGVVREPIVIRWLNAVSNPRPRAAKSSAEGELARQLEEVYGPDYVRQMTAVPNQEEKGEAKAAEASGASQKDNRPDPDREGRSGASGTGAGSAVGGMSGMGMGGMGGVGIGRMGMGTGASSGQEQLQRQPGESEAAYRARLAQIRAMHNARAGGGMGGTGMGGMSGMMGGMGMGGMGMGGAVGGMMGGMGGIGFDPTVAAAQQGVDQTATLELQVHLPDTVPALAEEFLKAIVKNLQDSLSRAHKSYEEELVKAITEARLSYAGAQSDLDDRADDAAAVRRQLESLVDLSQLTSATPFATAIEMLRKSVEPPLNIVVLWRDMMSNAHAEPSSPINIEGSPKIRLATALDLLVKGFDAGVDTTKPIWRIKGDAIVIGTTATLGGPPGAAGQPQVETDARNLAGQRSELARRIQSLELDLAGLDARRAAIVGQVAIVQQQVNEKVAKDPVVQELEKLAQMHSTQVGPPDKDGRRVTYDTSKTESAIRARIELANRREELSKQVGGSQLEEFNKELSRMAIDKAEKEAQHLVVQRQLDEVQKQLAQALTFDPEAARLRLAQESLDIAARRVAELQTRLSNLQPPMVTVIGAN